MKSRDVVVLAGVGIPSNTDQNTFIVSLESTMASIQVAVDLLKQIDSFDESLRAPLYRCMLDQLAGAGVALDENARAMLDVLMQWDRRARGVQS